MPKESQFDSAWQALRQLPSAMSFEQVIYWVQRQEIKPSSSRWQRWWSSLRWYKR